VRRVRRRVFRVQPVVVVQQVAVIHQEAVARQVLRHLRQVRRVQFHIRAHDLDIRHR
jgi:hypothetical protein